MCYFIMAYFKFGDKEEKRGNKYWDDRLMSDIKSKVIEVVKKIYDPEIPVNIYELGLIYKIEVDEKNKVNIDMTLTSPNCPVAESLPKEVKENIMKVEGVFDVNLNLVWEPPWDKDKMSEAAKLELNLWANK